MLITTCVGGKQTRKRDTCISALTSYIPGFDEAIIHLVAQEEKQPLYEEAKRIFPQSFFRSLCSKNVNTGIGPKHDNTITE